MSLNNLISLKESIIYENSQIEVPSAIITEARKPIERLLEFASDSKQVVFGNNDA